MNNYTAAVMNKQPSIRHEQRLRATLSLIRKTKFMLCRQKQKVKYWRPHRQLPYHLVLGSDELQVIAWRPSMADQCDQFPRER